MKTKTKKAGFLLLVLAILLSGGIFIKTEKTNAFDCLYGGNNMCNVITGCNWQGAGADSCSNYTHACTAGKNIWGWPASQNSVCLINRVGADFCKGSGGAQSDCGTVLKTSDVFYYCSENKCEPIKSTTYDEGFILNIVPTVCWVTAKEAGSYPLNKNPGDYLSGFWDYKGGVNGKGQCVRCNGASVVREHEVLGDSNNTYVSGSPLGTSKAGNGLFEHACGADASCDEKDTGDVCTGGHCDKNGICCPSPKIVNGDGDCVSLATCDTDPTVKIFPPSIITTAGARKGYIVEVTNNDDASCGTASRTFTLTVSEPGWQVEADPISDSIAVGKNSLTVTSYILESPVGTAAGPYTFTITATDDDGSGSGNGSYIINNCPPGIVPGVDLKFDEAIYDIGDTMTLTLNNGSAGATDIVIADPSGSFKSLKVSVPAGSFDSVTYTAELPTGMWIGIGGAIDCTVTAEVIDGGGGGGGCTIIWSDWGDCTGNLGTQIRTDTNCGTGGTKSRFCCDTDSGNTIPDNHCVLTTPICDTSVPPGECVECLVTPDCDAGEICDNKICIPCKGEGEEAIASHLCCYGLNWLNGICTSACDPNAWFFCNPLRGNVETLAEGGERIIGYILGLIGSVALLLIIISGAMYMTSAGSEERIASSKKILTAAVIGLAIALLAYSLLLVIMTVLGM